MSRNHKKKWNEQSFTIQASGRQAPLHPGGLPMVHVGKDKWKFAEDDINPRRLSVRQSREFKHSLTGLNLVMAEI